jgi:hypothetical protein
MRVLMTIVLWFGAAFVATSAVAVMLEKWRAPPQDGIAAFEPVELGSPTTQISQQRTSPRMP